MLGNSHILSSPHLYIEKPGQPSNRLCKEAGESTPDFSRMQIDWLLLRMRYDIELDRALASPIMSGPVPNLFTVMIIGRHYEDRRAQERRIFPSPPEHGRHGVFLLYSVRNTPLSCHPLLFGPFFRKFYFQLHMRTHGIWDSEHGQ